jgi:hypothetical protein
LPKEGEWISRFVIPRITRTSSVPFWTEAVGEKSDWQQYGWFAQLHPTTRLFNPYGGFYKPCFALHQGKILP